MNTANGKRRIVVGISGASGAIYGIRLLECLRDRGVESHLVISDWAKRTIEMETAYSVEQVMDLADVRYDLSDLGASVSSGSFRQDGMVIAPCSMKTLAGIAQGLELNLIMRAASVTLKEQRKLVLLARETPLTSIHLEHMLTLARMGVVIMPPVPAMYNQPASVAQIIDHTVSRALDHLRVDNDLIRRWGEE